MPKRIWFLTSEKVGERPTCIIDLANADFGGIAEPVPGTVEKKCSRCGEPFSCQQEMGCWCAAVRLGPATLAELRTRFSDCLCEVCLRWLSREPEVNKTIVE